MLKMGTLKTGLVSFVQLRVTAIRKMRDYDFAEGPQLAFETIISLPVENGSVSTVSPIF